MNNNNSTETQSPKHLKSRKLEQQIGASLRTGAGGGVGSWRLETLEPRLLLSADLAITPIPHSAAQPAPAINANASQQGEQTAAPIQVVLTAPAAIANTQQAVGFTIKPAATVAAPVLTASLTNPSGGATYPTFTNSATISGQVSDATGIASLKAGFDAVATSAYTDITSAISNGAFTLTPAMLAGIYGSSTIPDGAHTLHLIATDNAGVGTTISVAFTLDATPPKLTAMLSNPSGGAANPTLTNSADISGQVSDNFGLVNLKGGFDATAIGSYYNLTGYINNGAFNLTSSMLNAIDAKILPDGAHTFNLIATDKAGNVSTFQVSFTLDNVNPTVTAALSNPSGGSAYPTYTNSATISGQVSAQAAIISLKAGFDSAVAASYTDITSSLGNGVFTLSPAQLANLYGAAIPDGAHTLHLTATDAAGNSTTLNFAFTLDTTAPTLTAALSNPSGGAANPNLTNSAAISGQVNDAIGLASLNAGFNGAATYNLTGYISAGAFNLSAAVLNSINGVTLPNGQHTLTLTATDKAGNATTYAVTFTLDTVNPTVTAALSNPSGGTAYPTFTNSATVSGQVSDPVGVVKLKAGFDNTVAANYTDISGSLINGGFTLSPAQLASIYGAAIPDGAHTLHLTATDAAGNSTTLNFAFTLDTTAPALTAALSNPSGGAAYPNLTNSAAVSGQVSDNLGLATLKGGFDSAAVSSYYNFTGYVSAGAFNLSNALLNVVHGGPLPDGVHTLNLIATDKAGNATSYQLVFTLDTVKPTLTASVSNPTALTIGGQASDLNGIGSLKASVDSSAAGSYINITSYLNNGAFALTSNNLAAIYGQSLPTGANVLYLTATDNAGNSTNFSVNFTVPATVLTLTAALTNPTGGTAHPNLTSNATVGGVISDTNGVASLKASFSSSGPTTDVTNLISNGSFSLIASELNTINGGKTLTDGVYTLYLTATDNAGNSKTINYSFTLDTTPPTLTASVTNAANLTIGGQASDLNGIVSLKASFGNSGPYTDVTNLISNGSFSLNASELNTIYGKTLTSGTYTLYLTATDNADNTTPISLSITVPSPQPLVITASLINPSGGASNPNLSNSLTIGGQASDTNGIPSLKVSFSSGGTYTDVTSLISNGSYTLSSSELNTIYGKTLTDGTYTLYLSAADNAGNSKIVSYSFTLDTTAPTVTEALVNPSGGAANPNLTNNAVIGGQVSDLNGVASLKASFSSSGPATDVTSLIGNGGFSLSASELNTIYGKTLTDGTYTLYLSAADNAGNSKIVSYSFTVDTTAPTVTEALVNPSGGANYPNLSNSLTVGGQISDANGVASLKASFSSGGTYTSVTISNGAYTLSQTQLNSLYGSTLTDGTYTLYLQATDNAGNIKTINYTFTLDTTPPTVSEALLNPSGGSAYPNLTNNAIVGGQVSDLNGIASLKASFSSSGTYTNVTADISGNGYTLNQSVLNSIYGKTMPDGSYTLYLIATDNAGNSKTINYAFTLDTTPPNLSAGLVHVASGSGSSTVTYNSSITGQASDANGLASLQVSVDGGAYANITAQLSNGSYTLSPALLAAINGGQILADGAHTISMRATDNAGNISNQNVSFTLNTAFTPPAATDTWLAAAGGDWNTASNWSTGKVPGASDNVAITLNAGAQLTINQAVSVASLVETGGGTIVINGGGSLTSIFTQLAGNLTINGGTLNDFGRLTIGGALTWSGGAIAGGGVLTLDGTSSLAGTDTLDGMLLNGVLDETSGDLIIRDSLVGDTANGVAPAINVSQYWGATIEAATTETLNSLAINFINDSGYSYAFTADSGVALTLGKNLTVNALGYTTFNGAGSIDNQGAINVTGGSAISATGFSNEGVLTINGGTTTLSTAFTNQGAFAVNNGTLTFPSSYKTSEFGAISTGKTGAVVLTGKIDNSNATLGIGAGLAIGNLQLSGGTILNGVIQTDPTSFTSVGTSTLDGVTLNGVLNESSGDLVIRDGLTGSNANGVAPAINVSQYWGATIEAATTETLNSLAINFINDSGYSYAFTADSGVALTLGKNLTVNALGYTTFNGAGSIDNQGAINVTGGSAISATGFSNTGSITAQAGTLNIAQSFTDSGTLSVDAGAVMSVTGNLTLNPSAVLDIGVTNTGVGTVNVSGAASLNGTLNVQPNFNPLPAIGQNYTFMNFASDSGQFGTVNGLTLSSGEKLSLVYTDAKDLRLSVAAA